MLSDDVPESVIKKKLRDLGVRTIVDAGIEKIEQGVTSPDELLRIVTIEDFSFEH